MILNHAAIRDAGGEEQGIGGSRPPAVAESQPPQAVNHDRLSMEAAELAVELATYTRSG